MELWSVFLTRDLDCLKEKEILHFDFYQTNFENQVVVDWENPQQISFYNLDGSSIANSFQVETNYSPIDRLNIRTAYKFFDVSTDYFSGNLSKPIQPQHRFFMNASYETTKNDNGGLWKFDTTYNFIGKQRLPNTSTNPVELQLPEYSAGYNLLNAQNNKSFFR